MNRTEQTALMKIRLELLLYGRYYPGFRCDCGCIEKGKAQVIGVVPPEDEEDQNDWLFWTVVVEEVLPTSNPGYSVGLSAFLPKQKLEEMFRAIYAL